MKKLIFLTFALIVLAFSVLSASAQEEKGRLLDEAGIFTQSQRDDISKKLSQVSKEREFGVAIATTPLWSASAQDYANLIAETQDFSVAEGDQWVLLVVDPARREYYIYYNDEATDLPSGDLMEEYFGEYFRNNDFYNGCLAFVKGVDEELAFPLVQNLIITFAVGLIVALLVVGGMKSKLQSVNMVNHAGNYMREGSFVLEKSRDLYLYSTITRVPRPKQTNGSMGSRGGGGNPRSGGGRF